MRAVCAALVVSLGGTLALAAEPEGMLGKIRVAGSSRHRAVLLLLPGGEAVPLAGALVEELSRLHGIEVEVLGHRPEKDFEVSDYRILDVGAGAKPLVGILVEVGANLALRTGDSPPIPLSLAPRTAKVLGRKAGAKVWVAGKSLVTGQLQVLQYGILRDSAAAPPADDTPEPGSVEDTTPAP